MNSIYLWNEMEKWIEWMASLVGGFADGLHLLSFIVGYGLRPSNAQPFHSNTLCFHFSLLVCFHSIAPAKTGSPIPFFSSLMSEIKEELSWWNGLLLRWKLITHYRGIWKTCFSMKRAAEDSHSTTSFRNKNNFLLRPLKRKVYFYLLHFTCGMRENKNIL